MSNNVIEVKDLKTYFSSNSGLIKAVDGISFNVPKGKTFAIVGESGSGKSVTALSIMRLIPKSPDMITEGKVMFGNIDLLKISEREMTNVRGREIGMVFQEPSTSLNPVMKIGDQVKEVVMIHNGLKKRQAKEKAVDMLGKLGIESPETIIDKYPHQMSGGMKQRIMIAMALICAPKLLIADEPTTSLDVTIQAVIIDIIKRLQTTLNMSIIFITHDLGVVAEVADYVAV
ncbi:MAG: ABC transporter ATP-binding protein, partial [Candidatus Anammoxibacter sp.]